MDECRHKIIKKLEDGETLITTYPKTKTNESPTTDWAAEWGKQDAINKNKDKKLTTLGLRPLLSKLYIPPSLFVFFKIYISN